MRPFAIHIPMLRKKGMPEKMAAFYEDALGYEPDEDFKDESGADISGWSVFQDID